jgi:glycerophosphoryl diester phosphodiesterase
MKNIVSSLVAFAAFASCAADVRYFSNEGDDAADGLTPATAWRTLEKLDKDLPAGGEARLRRGDVFYGKANLKPGPDAAREKSIRAANVFRSSLPQGTELFRCQVHRGGGKNTRPDNALETFLWCWGHGVAPEADARLTKDGVAIALHDETLKRVGRGISAELASAKIKDLDWAQVRDVDTGSYLDPAYSSTRIPTIDSVFAAMAGRPDRMLYLDEKGAPSELLAELARKHGVERQIYYTSWNFELMAKWQKLVPNGLGMVWLGTWPTNNAPESVARADRFLEDSLDRMAASGWKGVSQVQIHIRTDLSLPDPFCPSSACIRKAIDRLHANGVTAQAITWTEGANKDALRKIWKLGFDNFATDDPLVLFELLPDLARRKDGE